ncbi:Type I inositol 1,4,5-trisphosphate 5-phosphatase [Eumeta japonica]|uniref:Type I inositol 1,4,5-trisphosphate 5-phosphatase n=1 Tax=Eumeta variegata TaxID=151549 RepID=A0A4C1VDE9_EUMVA|nr:Type I inositol 1,4,5-trisphosphate 5-phosphatase [Eumeta japonica]
MRDFWRQSGATLATINFMACKWSRKGFLRTRWMIRGTAVEFVNIHLFHDASNLVAMEPFPSVGTLFY